MLNVISIIFELNTIPEIYFSTRHIIYIINPKTVLNSSYKFENSILLTSFFHTQTQHIIEKRGKIVLDYILYLQEQVRINDCRKKPLIMLKNEGLLR